MKIINIYAKLVEKSLKLYYILNKTCKLCTTNNFIAVGSPIVLQRRGSVYGANVPMITGNKKDSNKSLYFYILVILMYENKNCEISSYLID